MAEQTYLFDKTNMNEIQLVMTPNIAYVTNMQSQKGKSNIFCEVKQAKGDDEAIYVYTKNREGKNFFLGYVMKNEIRYVYSERADELYGMVQSGELSWEEGRDSDGWAEIAEVIKTPVWSDDELKQIVENINSGLYRFRFDYNDYGCGYLFKI